MALFKFEWNCGRCGTLTGIFESDKETVAKLIGREVYFGEVLGKHSEVQGEIKQDEIRCLTEDEDFILKAKELGLVPMGINPLEYLKDEDA